MNKLARKKKGKRILAVALGLTFSVAVVLVAASAGGDGPSQAGSVDEPAAAAQAEPRTVLVSDVRPPQPSLPGSPLHALRVSGSLPDRRSEATVLTDEDCAPDARGISRCLNRIRLAGGGTLSVRHPHRMMEVPCLSPGERVSIQPA